MSSSLIRAVPPLCLAVLCPLRCLPLGVLPLAARGYAPGAGRDARRFTDGLRSVQALLGDHHDTVISRDRLAVLTAELGLEETLDRVLAIEEAGAETVKQEFLRSWPPLARRLSSCWPLDDAGTPTDRVAT